MTVFLYWVAQAYSHHWGERLNNAGEWSLKQVFVSFAYETSILAGAAGPTVVLVGCWIAGTSTETAVTAVLWTAGLELLLLEVVPGIRHRLKLVDMAVQTVLGVSMGAGILGVRVLLH